MKYAMLSTLIPKEFEESYRKNTKNTMQDAANVLQWNIYEGLSSNLGVKIPLFNILPVDSFPQYYKFPFVEGGQFDDRGYSIGFCNVKWIRNYFKPVKIYHTIKKWCYSEQEPKILFVYTLSPPFVTAVRWLKRKFPELTVCVIVADLPNMSSLSSKKSFLREVFVKNQSEKVFDSLENIDGFILLTEHMAEYLHLNNPYCVMEGIADVKDLELKACSLKKKEKYIVYTGTLHKKFGILHLLKAFQLIADDTYRLVICGIGDGENDIKNFAEKDSRISYLGQLPREEVLKIQRKADVLVNPRLNNEEFTKYSFPSKTMEYLVSGIPVVAYKLDGIPKEYDCYIQYPENDTIEKLAEKLQEVCDWSLEKKNHKGSEAFKFLTQEKNKYVQTKKIIRFVDELKNKGEKIKEV